MAAMALVILMFCVFMIKPGQKLCAFGFIRNYGVHFLDLMTISVALAHSASLYIFAERMYVTIIHVRVIEVTVCCAS